MDNLERATQFRHTAYKWLTTVPGAAVHSTTDCTLKDKTAEFIAAELAIYVELGTNYIRPQSGQGYVLDTDEGHHRDFRIFVLAMLRRHYPRALADIFDRICRRMELEDRELYNQMRQHGVARYSTEDDIQEGMVIAIFIWMVSTMQ